MKVINYKKYIEDKLLILSRKIESNGKLNILDYHVYAEKFYCDLLNLFYGYSLCNLNMSQQNAEAIDLIDNENKIVIQISATSSRQKIEDSLSKDIIKKYTEKGYTFKFVSISKNAEKLRKITDYKNPFGIIFNPNTDIIDVEYLLEKFISLGIDEQEKIYELIKKSLGTVDIDIVKVDSNLSFLIDLLSKEDLSVEANNELNLNSFEIEKKIEFNNLIESKEKIEEYKIYNARLTNKYEECDKIGKNKSLAILNKINKLYRDNSKIIKNSDELYDKIIKDVISIIKNSANYVEIPDDELDLCVEILTVDAFIRCKIFKNPNNYSYAITG